jgi:hypothetical protein
VDSKLIEHSVYGLRVKEGCVNKLLEQRLALETEGKSRSSHVVVELLVLGCRMGLHEMLQELMVLIKTIINEDENIVSMAQALHQLVLLWEAREPLQAAQLTQLPELMQLLYNRIGFQLRLTQKVPEEVVADYMQAMVSLRELIVHNAEWFEPAIYHESLRLMLDTPQLTAEVAGCAAGVLHSGGVLPSEALTGLIRARLQSSMKDVHARIGFLRGLVFSARELLWHNGDVVTVFDELLGEWDDDEFFQLLPHMRLAFSHLTPAEVDRTAECVAALHGERDLGSLHHYDISDRAVQWNTQLTRQVLVSLERDHLRAWTGRKDKSEPPL